MEVAVNIDLCRHETDVPIPVAAIKAKVQYAHVRPATTALLWSPVALCLIGMQPDAVAFAVEDDGDGTEADVGFWHQHLTARAFDTR